MRNVKVVISEKKMKKMEKKPAKKSGKKISPRELTNKENITKYGQAACLRSRQAEREGQRELAT